MVDLSRLLDDELFDYYCSFLKYDSRTVDEQLAFIREFKCRGYRLVITKEHFSKLVSAKNLNDARELFSSIKLENDSLLELYCKLSKTPLDHFYNSINLSEHILDDLLQTYIYSDFENDISFDSQCSNSPEEEHAKKMIAKMIIQQNSRIFENFNSCRNLQTRHINKMLNIASLLHEENNIALTFLKHVASGLKHKSLLSEHVLFARTLLILQQ